MALRTHTTWVRLALLRSPAVRCDSVLVAYPIIAGLTALMPLRVSTGGAPQVVKIFSEGKMTEAPPGAQQFSFEFKKSNVDVALKSAQRVSILALSAVVKDAKATGVYYHNKFAKAGEAPQQLVARKARPSSRVGCQ